MCNLNKDMIEGTKLNSVKSNKSYGKVNHKGISYDKSRNRYKAFLQFKGKVILKQNFKTLDEAICAREMAYINNVLPFILKHS